MVLIQWLFVQLSVMIAPMKTLDFSAKNPVLSSLNRTLAGLVLTLVFVLGSTPVLAIEIQGLYQGVVNVESRDDVRERERAFTEALRQVLLKVTGNSSIYSQPMVRRALVNADNYVDTWSYRTVTLPAPDNGEQTETGIELSVSFFQSEVLSLLETADIPLWPRNRPYTLVWLVVQNELGSRELVGSSTAVHRDIQAQLESEAQIRGLPLLLPILDFEDLRSVSANDVWEMDAEKLLAASARYQSESVLVVRLFRTLTGEVLGKSNYLFRGQVFEMETYEQPAETFIRDSIGLAADEMAAYYAVRLSGTESTMEVNLTVSGISNAEDYAGLLDYVSELTDVNSFRIARVKEETIELKLGTGGQLRQLVETIALNRNLQPAGDLVRDDNQVYMSYQWQK